MQTLFPVTIGEEWPRPTVLVFHFTSRRFQCGGPAPVSKTPFRCGPRQPGHSGFDRFKTGVGTGFGASGGSGRFHTTGSTIFGGPARKVLILRAILGAITGTATTPIPRSRAQNTWMERYWELPRNRITNALVCGGG